MNEITTLFCVIIVRSILFLSIYYQNGIGQQRKLIGSIGKEMGTTCIFPEDKSLGELCVKSGGTLKSRCDTLRNEKH